MKAKINGKKYEIWSYGGIATIFKEGEFQKVGCTCKGNPAFEVKDNLVCPECGREIQLKRESWEKGSLDDLKESKIVPKRKRDRVSEIFREFASDIKESGHEFDPSEIPGTIQHKIKHLPKGI